MAWDDNGTVYRVPFKHKAGEYQIKRLKGGEDSLEVTCFDGYDIVQRSGGNSDRRFRLYHVDEKSFDFMTAIYDKDGVLKNVGISGDDSRRFLYLRIDDPQAAENLIRCCAGKSGSNIAAELLKRSGRVRRLFSEYAWDGNFFDYHVIYATEDDVCKVFDRGAAEYGGDIIDNGGEYSHDDTVSCDTERLAVILSCIPDDFDYGFFRIAVNVMDKYVRGVIPQLDRTDDFKFISEQYD